MDKLEKGDTTASVLGAPSKNGHSGSTCLLKWMIVVIFLVSVTALAVATAALTLQLKQGHTHPSTRSIRPQDLAEEERALKKVQIIIIISLFITSCALHY